MPRFVVLTHNHPALHWDLMLEKEATLRAWKLFRPPSEPGPSDAQSLPDHRLMYLDYEGPVSNNRGEVHRWDVGEYILLKESDRTVELRLDGQILRGIAVLVRTDTADAWTFRFTPVA